MAGDERARAARHALGPNAAGAATLTHANAVIDSITGMFGYKRDLSCKAAEATATCD